MIRKNENKISQLQATNPTTKEEIDKNTKLINECQKLLDNLNNELTN
jgi:hypothetical protein